ncbi:MAG: acetyl-coenzyme A synthetase N-terminal domain-containing protein [Bacillota bacterium]
MDDALYRRAGEDRLRFWAEMAEELHWFKKWDKVLDETDAPYYRWFSEGTPDYSRRTRPGRYQHIAGRGSYRRYQKEL